MNTAYKHLDSKLRIGELTIGQWFAVAVGFLVAGAWMLYVHPPIGPTLTAVTGVYMGAMPAGAALMASSSEFNLFVLVRSAIGWKRRDQRFVPGPGTSFRGYELHADPVDERRQAARPPVPALDISALWEER
jgi:hypothetical protein